MVVNQKTLRNKHLIFLSIIILIFLILELSLIPKVTEGRAQDDYWMITLGNNFFNNFRYELVGGVPYDKTQPAHPIVLGFFLKYFNFIFNNPIQTGALLSVIFGALLIYITYIFWRRLEDKNIALLASFFVAFTSFGIRNSLALSSEKMFPFFLVLSVLFIYKSIKDERMLPLTAIIIVITALTRWEGYMLIPAAFFSLVIAKRKEMFQNKNLSFLKKDYFVIALIIIIVPLFLWSWRSADCCGSWIPSYGYQKQLSDPGKTWQGGFDYFKRVPEFIPFYMIILIFLGVFTSLRKYKTHYPVFITIIFILFIHLKFRGKAAHFYYLTPFLYGYSAMFIMKIKNSTTKKGFNKKHIFSIILALFLIFFLVTNVYNGYNSSKDYYKRLGIIRESMNWLGENSDQGDRILVGDPIVYQYFTENPLESYSLMGYWAGNFLQQNKINNPLIGYAAFMVNYQIKYFVAYDSTMDWFYTQTKDMAENFAEVEYNFGDAKVKFIPLKKFEEYNETIVLYQVEVTNLN